MVRRASRGVRGRYLDDMLVHVAVVHVMQMAVVQIVHMIAVADGRVTATRPMGVGVIRMLRIRAACHGA